MTAEAPAGAWLFRYRSFLPVPLALILLFVRTGQADGTVVVFAGVLLVLAGQLLRLWAVRHIGTISRTRTTRYGPLMTAGPYAVVRNPLYVGNWLLWTGFAVWSRLLWMVPVAWLVFFFQYRAIARWEASFIRSKLHDRVRRVCAPGQGLGAALASVVRIEAVAPASPLERGLLQRTRHATRGGGSGDTADCEVCGLRLDRSLRPSDGVRPHAASSSKDGTGERENGS